MKTMKILIYFLAIMLVISVYFVPGISYASKDLLISPKDYAKMVPIPEGDFFMGSPYNRGDADEQPQRKIYLDKFYIYKYEVTVKQYKSFCKDTGYKMPLEPSWGLIDSHPIVNISRYDAEAYCKWARVSLPTEAQWEKAARGTEGRAFPWGQKWDEAKMVNKSTSNGKTSPVGSYPESSSPYGVMDMAGNAWEWVADGYDEKFYTRGVKTNPFNSPVPSGKGVIRGGSWNNAEMAQFRVANRCWFYPDNGYTVNGFRCVYNIMKNKQQ
jgi:formylglycine-generating enzyme required for sulfatase activity